MLLAPTVLAPGHEEDATRAPLDAAQGSPLETTEQHGEQHGPAPFIYN